MGWMSKAAGRGLRGLVRKSAFFASLLVSLFVAESAWALTCDQVNGRTIEENDGNPATFNTETYPLTLQPGEIMSFHVSALTPGALVNLILNGVTVIAVAPGNYVLINATAADVTTNVEVFVHESRMTATGTCNSSGGGGGGGTPTTSGDEAAAKRDALQNTTTGSRPSSDPTNLPGSGSSDVDPCGTYQRWIGNLVTRRDELEFELSAIERRSGDLIHTPTQSLPGETLAAKIGYRERELDRMSKRVEIIVGDLEDISSDIKVARQRLGDCLEENGIPNAGANGSALPPINDPDELGDGERILYAPVAERFGRNVPWPVTAVGYAKHPMTTISTASQHGFAVGGKPANLWMRAQGSILDGTLGRTGAAGALQAGVVVGVTPAVDVGFLAHILTGTVQSATIGGSLTSVAGGVGLYTKINLPSGFRFGLSGLHEWGGHNITLGGATGFYTSSFWAVSAALSRPFAAGGWVVTPAVSGTWNHVTNGGYTDSAGLVVPSTSDSTLYFTGKLNVARPILRSGERVRAITPRFGVSANVFAQRARNLLLGGGLGTLTSAAFTLDLETGLAFALANGGTIDLALQARGLAGNNRSYTLQAGVRVPLN